MAIYEFRFPELGEGLHEGRIDKWLVKPGDTVQEDDAIAEVENDKAMVELPTPVSGKIQKIFIEAGATAVVGDVIVTFEVEGAGNVSESAAAQPAAPAPAPAAPTPAPTAPAPAPQAAPAVSAPAPAPAAVAQAPAPQAAPAQAGAPDLASHAKEVLAAPGVRKFARESGINITLVHGTGPNGKITKADVEQFAQGGTATAAAPEGAPSAPAATGVAPAQYVGGEVEERVALPGIRKIIAAAMAKSMYTAPHVTVMDEVNVTELVKLRAEVKPLAAERGTKITYLPFIVKAMVAALRRFPELNTSLDEERQELVYKRYYNIGIATDTERGLVVPVVRHADHKNMWAIADEITDLATRARTNRLTPAEMKGSTISITNIGSAGGMFFTPIINYPEVAILGVGRITEKPIIKNGEIVPAHMMALSLSFDHRVIDGALGQNFVNEIKRLLENPRLLLMEV